MVETLATVNHSLLQAYTQPEDHNNYLCYDPWAQIIYVCFIINYYYFENEEMIVAVNAIYGIT